MEAQKPKYVPQELKGRIVPNRNRTKDTSPEWTGELMVAGQHVRFGVWEKEGPYGKFFAIKVSDPNWKREPAPYVNNQQYPKEVNNPYNDSDVPF